MITRELLTKFLEGRCSPEELALLKKYLVSGGDGELDRILEDDWKGSDDIGNGREIEFHKKRIWGKLRDELVGSPPVRRATNRGAVAAVVSLCLLASGGFLFWGKYAEKRNDRAWGVSMIEQKNEGKEALTVSLADGSTVVLDPGSTLRFPEVFQGGERLVRLEGKAFFEVSRDTLNPFFVKTNSLNVRVLGTSFNVSSFEDKPAEVSVLTGKVEVFVGEQTERLILEPNERAVRYPEKPVMTKTLVEVPVLVSPDALSGLFNFDEAPVAEVFSVLEKAYDVSIVFDPVALKHCTLKARLDDQSLFTKLRMICVSMGLEYEVSGTDIVITGPGC